MKLRKDSLIWRYKWFFLTTLILIAASFLYANYTSETAPGMLIRLIRTIAVILGLFILSLLVMLIASAVKSIEENGSALKKVREQLEKNRIELENIKKNTYLSETAKSIAFRDIDLQALREAVIDKLHRQDFENTYQLLNEISQQPRYLELANKLKTQADAYQNATDKERENQIIEHIEKLLEEKQWALASSQIERLIQSFPQSQKALDMRQKLFSKKQERKKVLLTAWDDAVKRQDTDRSIEILRELDLFLTPNEALALQEAASDVFRNKLHGLGVQFSLAVSENRWGNALQVGKQIMDNFPNSRMAQEIKEKKDILEKRVKQNA